MKYGAPLPRQGAWRAGDYFSMFLATG
jgi:hypothetical protein